MQIVRVEHDLLRGILVRGRLCKSRVKILKSQRPGIFSIQTLLGGYFCRQKFANFCRQKFAISAALSLGGSCPAARSSLRACGKRNLQISAALSLGRNLQISAWEDRVLLPGPA